MMHSEKFLKARMRNLAKVLTRAEKALTVAKRPGSYSVKAVILESKVNGRPYNSIELSFNNQVVGHSDNSRDMTALVNRHAIGWIGGWEF